MPAGSPNGRRAKVEALLGIGRSGVERKASHVSECAGGRVVRELDGMIGAMAQPRLPVWFPATIVVFVALLFLVAYVTDPPMAYMLAGLMVACFAVTRFVDRAVGSDETSER